MFVCKDCGQSYLEKAENCIKCGGELVETHGAAVEPIDNNAPEETNATQAQPVITPVTAQDPHYFPYVQPKSSVPTSSKVKGIIGMILGIEGFAGALATVMCALAYIASSSSGNYYDAYDYYGYGYSFDFDFSYILFIYTIVFAIIHIAVGIVGLILCSSSRKNGFTSRIPSVGKVFSILTLILCGIASLISLITFAG